jgi:colanic acid biosynthesis protein WcaH
MWLDDAVFKQVIASTPLISIDLIVRDSEQRVLLGKRRNRPAQTYWFVPGGRVLKDELLSDAFTRLALDELGVQQGLQQSTFLGCYEHFYSDNAFGDAGTTHYVVLAYDLGVIDCIAESFEEQHSESAWYQIKDMLSDPVVHQYTKNYFL